MRAAAAVHPVDRYGAIVFADERRQVILELVRTNGAVSLKELARIVKTSEVTIRRDLNFLAAEGLLSRRHGGAVLADGFTHEPTYTEKSHQAAEEKAAIADFATGLVAEGDAIVIGAGTTTQALARRLSRVTSLTVVTNSLLVGQALARSRGVDVVMTGGTLRGSIYALVGGAAEQSLAGMRTKRAFISGNGLSAERGLSTPNVLVAGVDRALAAAAEQVIVLADHTKIGMDTMVQTVPPHRIDRVITDDKAPQDEVCRLREQGVQVEIVSGAAGSARQGDSVSVT